MRRFGYPTLLVASGGFLGTTARYTVAGVLDDAPAWPLATLVVNLAGAFALGLLLERLADRPETNGRRSIRLLVGTGFLGSFTTYSSFAVESTQLLAAGSQLTAVGYLAASLGVGVVACLAGIVLASWGRRRRGAMR